MDLHSVNFLHSGKPKLWYCVAPKDRNRLDELFRKKLSTEHGSCPQFMRHKVSQSSPVISVSTDSHVMSQTFPFKRLLQIRHVRYMHGVYPCLPRHVASMCLLQHVLMKPEVIEAAGIKVHRVVQHPGDFIINFPGEDAICNFLLRYNNATRSSDNFHSSCCCLSVCIMLIILPRAYDLHLAPRS